MNDERYRQARGLIEMGTSAVDVSYLIMALGALDASRADAAMLRDEIKTLRAERDALENQHESVECALDIMKQTCSCGWEEALKLPDDVVADIMGEPYPYEELDEEKE